MCDDVYAFMNMCNYLEALRSAEIFVALLRIHLLPVWVLAVITARDGPENTHTHTQTHKHTNTRQQKQWHTNTQAYCGRGEYIISTCATGQEKGRSTAR